MNQNKELESNPYNLNDIIGMTLENAYTHIALGDYTARIVKKDGEHYMCTCDYRLDRVNLTIENDKVIEFDLG